jgi:hypothetical protein
MSSSIRSKKMADTDEEELKLKLERYRSGIKPNKSILKQSGNTPNEVNAFKKDICIKSDGHPPSFRTSQLNIMHSCTTIAKPSVSAADHHLHILLQKIMTDVNSLVNTNKIEEVY